MYLSHITDFGLRALSATAIVLTLGATFEYGHAVTLMELLRPLLGA